MEPDEIKNFIRSEIQSYLDRKQFGVSKIQNHVHNGTDSSPISEVNLVKRNKYVSGFTFDTSGTYIIRGLNPPNMTRMVFYGFAANNADGTPATKRAVISGEAQFGRCFSFAGDGSGTITVESSPAGNPFVQASNSLYVDSTTLANHRVAIAERLAYAVDNASAVVASIIITDYTSNTLTIDVSLASNWKIQSNIIIT